MKIILMQIVSVAWLLGIILVAGCVAPPEETQVGTVLPYDPSKASSGSTTTTPSTQDVLADATPFQTPTTEKIGYSVLQVTTAIPQDQVCVISVLKMNSTFLFDKKAKRIDLQNPPMYINYTIENPYKIKGVKAASSKYLDDDGDLTNYEYISPYSYLEISVRDAITGEIYQQDGFGKSYGTSLNKTIQVRKSGDLLIEVAANNVTTRVGFWVKPEMNINNSQIDLSTLECRSQDQIKRLNQNI